MTTCAYRIPDTAGGEHDCGRPAVAVWTDVVLGSWPLCERHDGRARQLDPGDVPGWTRVPIELDPVPA